MSALLLLALISSALLLQLLVAGALAVRRYQRKAAGMARNAPVGRPPHLLPAWDGLREFRVVKREFEDVARSVCSFYLEPLDSLPLPLFKAGQFITISLHVPVPGQNPKIVTRCYSLSSKPGNGRFRISVKRATAPASLPDVPPGLASNHLHDHVDVGAVVGLKAPSGQFHIDPDAGIPLVLVAGGIGVTPLLSMLLWCLDKQPARTIHFYCGARNGQEQAFKPLLETLAARHPNLHLAFVRSCPSSDETIGVDYHHRGHVDTDLLRRTLPFGRHAYYVCGPAAMMESLVPGLLAWGVNAADIHYEAFGPASVNAGPIAAEPVLPAAIDITFEASGRTLAWDGRDQNLLDFAERNGLHMESGCRAGSCGSCETRIVSGDVTYRDQPAYEPAPGYCLPCVGRPASALVLHA